MRSVAGAIRGDRLSTAGLRLTAQAGAVAAAAGAGWLAVQDPAWSMWTAATVIFVVVMMLRLTVPMVIGLALVLVACSSTFAHEASSIGPSESVRVAAALLVSRLAWGPLAAAPDVDNSRAHTYRRFVRALVAGFVVYLVFATVTHEMYLELALYGAGAVMTIVYGEVIARHAGVDIRKGALVALTAIVAASLVFGLVEPAEAVVNDRLRGLTSNANLLGFYALLVVALLLSYSSASLWTVPVVLIASTALLWSGSRSAALAAALMATLSLAIKRSSQRALWVLASVAILVLAITRADWLTGNELKLLRVNNSRLGSYEYTLSVLESSFWSGIGLGAEAVEVASTPLRALTHAGIFGGVAVVAIYGVILAFSARVGPQTFVFGAVMVVHSLFEGWLLSPVGPMMMCFIVTWCAVAKTEAQWRRKEVSHAS